MESTGVYWKPVFNLLEGRVEVLLVNAQHIKQRLADLAVRRLRGKIPQLQLALCGRVTEHHRFPLGQLLRHLDLLDELIGQLSARIEQLTAPDAEAMGLLTAIPGVKQRTAEVLLAEVGPTVEPFPTPAQFASWAGLCPGNNESAGKRRTGRTRQGNRWLRQAAGIRWCFSTRTISSKPCVLQHGLTPLNLSHRSPYNA